MESLKALRIGLRCQAVYGKPQPLYDLNDLSSQEYGLG